VQVTGGCSVAVNVTEVSPEELSVNVACPVLEPSAVIDTACPLLKLEGVKVRLVGDAVRPVLPEVLATDTVTFEEGAEDSETATVPVLLCVIVCEAGVTIMLTWLAVGFSVAVTTAEV